ncbi:hypothetical protein WS58_29480 [Burkholderia pseudomultivorans]|nr:hypothetical protein WS57_24420 [Burkholderia pseudomultivorans]EGD03085.1 hypothetical protein B1M_18252 [Burkholderia sp. TJI49]KVC32774.1 hypothetical protein WS56_13970 [Burkholderia pseudomultivorans]KVC33611.1 hypothetical protein WS55_34215 [Burkholderia pseudomultivorans]KVC56181.1 hypothetical protein WS58_29480 [Burkholderia pseudomultivorans]
MNDARIPVGRAITLSDKMVALRAPSAWPDSTRSVEAVETDCAPSVRQSSAVRADVVPVPIRSSTMTAQRPAISPTIGLVVTMPPLRSLPANAASTGRPMRVSSLARKSSARRTPPASGDTTTTGRSPACEANHSTSMPFASRCSVGQRNAFWNAAML